MSTINPCSSGGAGSSGSGGSGGGGGPCGACKFLRRKCVPGCIFAPYFDSDQGAAHFAAVHRIFGASNVSKLLVQIPVHKRADAVITICFEAQARLRDPVYGCVSQIVALQQQVMSLQAEIASLQSHLSGLQLPSPPPLPQHPPVATTQPPLSMSDVLTLQSSVMGTSDLSSLLIDPMSQPAWIPMHQHPMHPRQYGVTSSTSSTSGGDLQALAQEFLHRHGPQPVRPSSMPNCDASSPAPSSSK